MAFLPEANLGIVVLSNARTPGDAFPYAVQYRLFELLFDLEPESEAQLSALVAAVRTAAGADLGMVDIPEVTPYLGRYASPELGAVTLSMRDDRLILDGGELSSALRPRADTTGDDAVYLLIDPPLSLLSEGGVVTLRFTRAADGQLRLHLTVAANQTGPRQDYVFAPGDGAETSSG